jgi:class 3 adenylate cyclase
MHEGSLNKFLMDDKGSTMIVVFGLPPASHQDDAVRAVLCSFALQNELKAMSVRLSIGIASGLVFAGVVGTSGNRREYSVIGDSVNLSARIMQAAC